MSVLLEPISATYRPALAAPSTVVVYLDQRYARTPDGRTWTESLFPYTFFDRYLRVFDRVRVVARVRDAPLRAEQWQPADGPGVEFAPVPYYVGMADYLAKRRVVRRAAIDAINPGDAILLRVPGQVPTSVEAWLQRSNRPYGVEVVGDPYDAYAPGAVKHPLRPVFRHWFRHRLRNQVGGAAVAAYVTREELQQRYPAPNARATAHYSSVELPPDAFVDRPRTFDAVSANLHIVTVGSLEFLYKGPDVLTKALAQCVSAGLDAELRFIGGGKCLPALKRQAQQAGLAGRVLFLGQLPAGPRVRAELDHADLFVLPSRAEGLPRAMIEAMARALPALGSDAGGIPELLHPEDVVPAGNADSLAKAILRVGSDPGRLAAMSFRNLIKAQEYREDVLRRRRDAFYRSLLKITDQSRPG